MASRISSFTACMFSAFNWKGLALLFNGHQTSCSLAANVEAPDSLVGDTVLSLTHESEIITGNQFSFPSPIRIFHNHESINS